jgi:hypothetical protein
VRVPHARGRVFAGYGVYARPVAAPGTVEFVTAKYKNKIKIIYFLFYKNFTCRIRIQ